MQCVFNTNILAALFQCALSDEQKYLHALRARRSEIKEIVGGLRAEG
jgi:hypothetical protein